MYSPWGTLPSVIHLEGRREIDCKTVFLELFLNLARVTDSLHRRCVIERQLQLHHSRLGELDLFMFTEAKLHYMCVILGVVDINLSCHPEKSVDYYY